MISKTDWRNLAVFGGEPAFAEPRHVGRPNLGDRDRFLRRVEAAFDRARLTNDGPFVRELETRLAAEFGVRNCVAVCNGTVGLEITIRALDLTGEVIVPSFTFAATAHALEWLGVRPVFCDVDPETHNLDPDKVEALITPATSGILGVHLWGRACSPKHLEQIAGQHGLKLVYDAAHAFGCSHGNRMIGGFGHAEVFSFHATKFFNTFEGGAITTDDDELAGRTRLMRNFGFAGLDNVVDIGTNGKLNEISAAMGLTLLEALEPLLETNRRTYERYRDQLDGLPGFRLLSYDTESNNCQYIVVEIDRDRPTLTRDAIVEILRRENVLARRYFYPGVHRMPPYRDRSHAPLPMTEKLTDTVLVLPGGALTEREVDGICALIGLVSQHEEDIAARLAAGMI